MRFPSKQKMAEMNRKLKDVEGTLMVNSDSTPSERFRWELCQSLVKYMTTQGFSQIEFANYLGIDQARVSEIVNHRIDKVSTDKLTAYNEKINPKVVFKIAR